MSARAVESFLGMFPAMFDEVVEADLPLLAMQMLKLPAFFS